MTNSLRVASIYVVFSLLIGTTIRAQNPIFDVTYNDVAQWCIAAIDDQCRSNVFEMLTKITQELPTLQHDEGIARLVLAIINNIDGISDRETLIAIAALLREIALWSIDAEQMQAILEIAKIIEAGQSISYSVDTLLASAN